MRSKSHESAGAAAGRQPGRHLLREVLGDGSGPPAYIEARWPIVLTVGVAVGLSATLPEHLTFGPTWLAPILEVGLLIPLLLTEPHWHPAAGWPWQRAFSTGLFGVLNASNLASLGLLVILLLHGGRASGAQLITDAGKIWATNILVFGLWYWHLDGGGPRARPW